MMCAADAGSTGERIIPWRKRTGQWLQVGLLVVVVFLVFYPFVFTAMTSLKTTAQFYHNFWWPSWPPAWENYSYAWEKVWKYIANSLFVTVVSVAGTLVCGTTAAFVFARFHFPGRGILFTAIVSVMMVPWIVTLVPTFLTVQGIEQGVKRLVPAFRLLDTHWVLILPYISGSQVLAIFLLRTFFASLPQDYFDAARIDGAGMAQMFWHVALPLSLPSISAVAIITTLGCWNNFMWPLVTISTEARQVLPVGLLIFSQQYGQQYGAYFAGILIGSVPLVLLFAACTRVFLRGVTAGAFKM